MCGLVGAVGAIGHKEREVIKTLFILDLVRGHHSSGMAIVNSNQEANVIKDLGTPFELTKLDRYKTLTSGVVNLMMCHNRYATRGAQTVKNAHPFEIDHIIGAHNGTVHQLHTLKDGNKLSLIHI